MNTISRRWNLRTRMPAISSRRPRRRRTVRPRRGRRNSPGSYPNP